MEWNGMSLSKGKEWNGIKVTLIGCFKINEWKWENEWNVSNLVWEQHGGNGMESFSDNITIRPLF